MSPVDIPQQFPQHIELTQTFCLPEKTSYILQLEDLMRGAQEEANTITPSDLIQLYLTDYPTFLKKFYEYITSEDMKKEVPADFDREGYKKCMHQYFIDMNEDIPLKEIPLPLKRGYEDLFREGMGNMQFKKEIRAILVPDHASYDKKTDKLKGIMWTDAGNLFTGKLLTLMIDLYNKGAALPTPTPTPTKPSQDPARA